MILIDSHAHLDDAQYQEDFDAVLQRAEDQDVKYILCISQDLDSSRKNIRLAEKYPQIYTVIGYHPHLAKDWSVESSQSLEQLSHHEKVVAIGEIGLDFHYDFSPRDIQNKVFREMMNLAFIAQKPVVIHSRESHPKVLDILAEYQEKVNGVIHCFSGDRAILFRCLELGYYISIGGPVTFKKSDELREIVKSIPLDRLLIETDCPYLAPVPYRGKRNEPAHVSLVAEKIAEIRCLPIEEIGSITSGNAKRLFRLPIL
jgi:TatD DNase family protein